MSKQIDQLTKTYRALASIPLLLGAKLINKGTTVISKWSCRNLEQGKVSKFIRTQFINSELSEIGSGLPFDISNELLVSLSPSGLHRTLIRDIDNKNGRKQHLEIWSNGTLATCIDLSSLELHGDVYTDAEFGTLEWSADETKLVYIAEKYEPKSEPFFKRSPVKQDPKISESVKGEQNVYKQDWGEQLVNKKQSVVVVYDIPTESFKIMEGIPEGLCPAQPTWAPDGSYIVGVAYQTHTRKLGLIYCSNRASAIFKLDFNNTYEEISPQGKSVKCPKFTPDGKALVWLQRDTHGPHASCMSLIKRSVPLKQGQIHIVVDIVQTALKIAEERSFYGLYCTNLAKRCWASNNRLILSTSQKCSINTYVINIDSGFITELPYSSGSQIVLDVYDDILLVNRKTFLVPDKLAIGRLPVEGHESSIIFEELTEPLKLNYAHKYICNHMDLSYDSSEDVVKNFSAIYIGPSTGREKSVPLIIWPHGGPHSVAVNQFSLEAAMINSLGFGVLFVNYRGSVGAGQATINFLLGRIGQSDVSDCILAIEKALQQFPWLDPKRLGLVGGSHGGFLLAHLCGRYPDMFKAAVIRNPVVDIYSLSIMSDIPDWAFVECGLSYTQVGKPDENALIILQKASPIQYCHNVKAPVLLQIGSKDLRVPAAQGIEYFHRLKANGKIVRMNLYDDNHTLVSTVPNETDYIMNSILWLQEHI